MKTYFGDPGPPPELRFAVGNGKPKAVKFRGTHIPANVWAADDRSTGCFALAVLDDLLNDPVRALRLMMRFKHRVAVNWKPDQPWQLGEDEIRAIIADIESVESATAPMRRIVALEPAPIMTDRGSDITWSKQPELVVNRGKK